MIFIYAWENSGGSQNLVFDVHQLESCLSEISFRDFENIANSMGNHSVIPKLLHLKLRTRRYAAGGFEKRTHLSFFPGVWLETGGDRTFARKSLRSSDTGFLTKSGQQKQVTDLYFNPKIQSIHF